MLLALCFLSSLALAGFMPLPMAHAQGHVQNHIQGHAVASVDQGKDCDHHAPKERNGHAKMDCCAAGYCPIMGQGMLPAIVDSQPALNKSVLYPPKLTIQSGLASAPSLRPPRSVI